MKYARGRNLADCIPDDEAERLIYESAKRAVRLIGEIKPFRVAFPAKIEIEYNRADYLDSAMKSGRLERLDARRAVRWAERFDSFYDLLP